jgi:hypothetical protein
MVYGQWSTERWSMDTLVDGRWTMVDGEMVDGQWSMDDGR